MTENDGFVVFFTTTACVLILSIASCTAITTTKKVAAKTEISKQDTLTSRVAICAIDSSSEPYCVLGTQK